MAAVTEYGGEIQPIRSLDLSDRVVSGYSSAVSSAQQLAIVRPRVTTITNAKT
jgi:hypothetical protein